MFNVKSISQIKMYLVPLLLVVLFLSACCKKPAGQCEPEQGTKPAPTTPAGMAPIPLELPTPLVVGTPESLDGVENLRPPGELRPAFLAPAGVTNVALGKVVSSSSDIPIVGELEMITDGDKEATDGSYVELGPFTQHVTIDLEAQYDIYAIVFWHYHKSSRAYRDVIVQIADDPDFIINTRTLFNSDHDGSTGLGIGTDQNYVDTHEGELVDAKGSRARYIRLYSSGNSNNDMNHYIEVEVYGKPVE